MRNVYTNSASNAEEYMYDLIGVSTHVGSLSSGHYTAYASSGEGNWVFFNDEKLVPSGHNNGKKTWASTRQVYMPSL